MLCCPSLPEGSACVGGSQAPSFQGTSLPFSELHHFPGGTRKLSSASRLPISKHPAGVLALPGHSLHFQMCSDRREGSWSLGQLTASSTFSRTFIWCFWCMLLSVRDVFSLRGGSQWQSCPSPPSVSWLHVLVHFLSNLNARLGFCAGDIAPCKFRLSFPPLLAL